MIKRIYVDMDGTVANFYKDNNYLEKMFEKGFFLNLEPYELAKVINDLCGVFDITILSACVDTPFCKSEKIEWLKKHMPNVKKYIFCKVGENKTDFVKDIENTMLIDDYSKNIYEWEKMGGKTIKALNQINNVSGKSYTNYIKVD